MVDRDGSDKDIDIQLFGRPYIYKGQKHPAFKSTTKHEGCGDVADARNHVSVVVVAEARLVAHDVGREVIGLVIGNVGMPRVVIGRARRVHAQVRVVLEGNGEDMIHLGILSGTVSGTGTAATFSGDWSQSAVYPDCYVIDRPPR